MAGKRNNAVDIARGIAMFSIVLGHLGVFSINRVVFTYHLPIFYLISGFFFHETSESYRDFMKYKGRRMLLPYYFTCFLICLLAAAAALWRGEDVGQSLSRQVLASLYAAGDGYDEPFKIYSIGAIWFLWATFWGELFLKAALRMKQGTRIFFVFLLFGLSIWSYKIIWLPLSIQAGMCALLFMYIGHILREFRSEIRTIKIEYKVFFTVIAFFMWLWMVKNFKAFWLVHCEIGNGIADVIGSLCGCYLLYLVSVYIDNKFHPLSRLLSFFGRYSLLFLSIHLLEVLFFPYGKVYSVFSRYIPATEASWLGFLICCKFIVISICVLIASRIPLVRKIYGYRIINKNSQ